MNLLNLLAKVSSFTFLSRILGFVRDFVIARVFGAGMLTDAFFVAFRLPNLLRRLFAEGAFSQAFVPVLSEYRTTKGEGMTKILVNQVFSLLLCALFVVTLLGILGSSWIITVSAPGFLKNPEKFDLAVLMTQICFPYILLMSLVAFSGGILNTWGKFSIPAITPVFLNLAFIGMAYFAAPYFEKPVLALAWAVIVGGVLQLLLQVPALAKIKMLPRFAFSFNEPGVFRILRLMAPALLGVSVAQVSLLINTIIASLLGNGSVSWLYYADRLMEFPSGMLGAALGTLLLPSLSRYVAKEQWSDYQALLNWGLRLVFLLAAPAALALAILATPLIATLFFHGAFAASDVVKTSEALLAYSVGLVALILIKVLAPGFYARQNVKTPVKIAIFSLVFTQVFNFILIFVLRWEQTGLALSISLAACANAFFLYFQLRKKAIFVPNAGWLLFLGKLALALVVMGGVLFWLRGDAAAWLLKPFWDRLLHLSLLVVLGLFAYFATLWGVGFRLRDFKYTAS